MPNKSLAATIELSLASQTFQELGPDARELLGVIAFFPRGVNEKNADWLFPTISSRAKIINKFCVLSLTYRSDGFITMLAPLRDHLRPKDTKSSSLLCATKDQYFARLSIDVDPNKPGFKEAQWITSEDANVEHLLDVFTMIDADSSDVWDACASFASYLYYHKKRLVALGPKILGLPDSHPSKAKCLFSLSRLFESVGNHREWKNLLGCALWLWRKEGNDGKVAEMLRYLSDANRQLGFYDEGIEQAREALEISERLHDTLEQADCLLSLTILLSESGQFKAAEETVSRTIDLCLNHGRQYRVCICQRLIGFIYQRTGEIEKATTHRSSRGSHRHRHPVRLAQ